MNEQNENPGASKNGLLNWIERVGNKLPDPVTLFVIGAGVVLVLSEVASRLGWNAVHPVTNETVEVMSLLSSSGTKWAWENLVSNFTGFRPLGVVLVAMIGIGVAERSGLIGALLKAMVIVMPQNLITPTVIFVGVMSSMALDAGYVVLPPLAAAVFMRAGRSPLVGMGAVFAGVAAGFSANLMITSLDPMLQGFTEQGAKILDPDYQVDVRCNYYFMIASTILITLVGWVTTRLFVEPRFSDQDIQDQIHAASAETSEDTQHQTLSQSEKHGLIWSSLALAAGAVGILVSVNIDGFSLSGKATGSSMDAWVAVIVPILFVLFLLPGLAYGIASETVKNDRDVAKMMGQTMSSMGPYIVLAFFAAQFVAWFDESKLGLLIALNGIEVLRSMQMPTWQLVIGIVLLTGFLNLFIGSASAKWAMISTVFVPIFAGVGISPELTQAAYRVGDSVTNSITPLNPYMVIILVFMQKYMPKAGIGSLISLMLPYTIAFLIAWILLLLVWMTLGIPLGPGDSPMFITPLEAVTE